MRTNGPLTGLTLAAAVVWQVAAAPGLLGQGMRGWVGSSVRYVEARPMTTDSFAFADAIRDPSGSYTVDGRPVVCPGAATCTALVPGGVEHAAVASYQLGLTAWGAGISGLSFTGVVQARDQLGGEFQWPRSDDHLDIVLGYLEWTRSGTRIRLGRQAATSGLGFASFDGLEATALPHRSVRVQAFVGRSLARGLLEPRNEALRGLEDFVPDDQAYLIGGALRVAFGPGTTLELRAQREAWTDGHLISERTALTLRTRELSPLSLAASADYDFGFGRLGKAHLSVEVPASNDLTVRARVRRYVPYFELSTIWGFFGPVAYHEGDLEAQWSPSAATRVWGGAAWRRYEDAEATVIRRPLEDDALQFRSGGRVEIEALGSLTGEYRIELGAGSYLHTANVNATWRASPTASVDLRGSAFQQIGEFRLGDALVLGGGMVARARLAERFELEAGALRYRTVDRERDDARFDGSLDRLWTSVRVDIGLGGAGS